MLAEILLTIFFSVVLGFFLLAGWPEICTAHLNFRLCVIQWLLKRFDFTSGQKIMLWKWERATLVTLNCHALEIIRWSRWFYAEAEWRMIRRRNLLIALCDQEIKSLVKKEE
jgi:hypothetical protein